MTMDEKETSKQAFHGYYYNCSYNCNSVVHILQFEMKIILAFLDEKKMSAYNCISQNNRDDTIYKRATI